MDIYLLRASLAADDSPSVPEAQRYLSLEGRQLVRALGQRLKLTEEPSFDRVLAGTSPAAVQTAELFADRTDYVGLIEVTALLSGTTPPEVIAPALLAGGSSVVVVADEPLLGRLGAFLVGRPTFPPSLHGQVSLIRDRQPAWCLRPGEPARAQLLVA